MNNLTIPMTLSIDSPIPIQLQQQVAPRLSMTNELKTALLQIAEKVAYIDDNGQQYYQDLYDALYPPAATYTITNTLTGCTSSNSAVAITEGDSYSATITASSGYSLTGATVSITMGGSDITASAYTAGTISIASVTGDLSITVTAVAVTVSSISAVYTQSGTVYDTDSLDSLKADLVVTATYSNSSTAVIPSTDYTLSGTLTVGTSTVTVSYGGKTDTFTTTVTSYREGLFGTFINGIGISQATTATASMPAYRCWRASTAARACTTTPCTNNNYTFTVTDSTKYNISVKPITDNTPQPAAAGANYMDNIYYKAGSMAAGWLASDSVNTAYCWIALKKNDNTSFTAEELANGAEEVFTFTSA